ncbi:MAG: hypothetical protein ACJATE_001691 [Bacteroidia bacterium]|jgi:hypothetical protein
MRQGSRSKHNWVISIGIGVVGILIGSGIASVWYWGQLQLRFDSVLFNNIFGPLFSLAGVVVYGVTLGYLIQQNRILHSNSVKDHVNARYEKLLSEIQSYSHKDSITDKILQYQDVPMFLMEQIIELSTSSYFREAVEKIAEITNLRSADVYDSLGRFEDDLALKFIQVTDLSDSPMSNYLQLLGRIKKFTVETKASKLLEDEKVNWEKRIWNELLGNMLVLRFMHLTPANHYDLKGFPRIFNPNHKIELRPIEEFRIFEFLNWFEANLTKDEHSIIH